MIVTCFKCSTKYNVPDESFDENGRQVRCNKCGHTWLQEPEYAISEDSIDSEFENILAEAIGETSDEFDAMEVDLVDATPSGDIGDTPNYDDMPMSSSKRKAMEPALADNQRKGLMAACCLGLIAFTGFSLSKTNWLSSGPTMYATYEILGMAEPIAGEDFIFENLDKRIEPNSEGSYDILISGTIINISEQERSIPRLKIQLQDSDGLPMDVSFLKLDEKFIQGEQQIEFSTALHGVGNSIKFLQISFENPFAKTPS